MLYVSSTTLEPLVNEQTPTRHGRVEALDSHNGSMRWSAILQDPPSTSVVAGEHALLLAWQKLIALNITDGSVAWTFAPPGAHFYLLGGSAPPLSQEALSPAQAILGR
jgi:hypothetical protein